MAKLTREDVINQVLAATTPDDCAAARVVLLDYLREHPEDDGVREAGEQLEMMRQAAELVEAS